MKTEITPEELLEYGKILDEIGWRELHVEKRLEGLSAEERLQGLDPEQRLQGLTPEEIEAYLEKLKRNKH